MNVLFVDQFSDPGGAQQCLLDLMPAMRERGWSAHFAMPGGGAMVERLRALGATVDAIPCGPYSFGRKSAADVVRYGWELPRLRVAIERLATYYGVQLIYCNGPRVLPAAAWAARGRCPLVFHCHLYLGARYTAWLAGRSLRLAGATVIPACRFFLPPLLRYVPRENCRVVYCGVRGDATLRREFRPEQPWRIGVIGRIAPQKGQAEFLAAARLLAARLPPCRFVICGAPIFGDRPAEKYLASLRQAAEGLPVEFTGWQDDVPAVLASLDLLVLPSMVEEAAPRVILEAYAAGVPVVAFPVGGVEEIVVDGATGFLVPSRTPAALAETIAGLTLHSPERLREAAEAGRAAWRAHYTLERYQSEITSLMEEAVCGTARATA